jgi:hypothetical protein
MQAMRSPEVCAEKAPWVNASKGWASWFFALTADTSGVGSALADLEKENIDIAH